MENISTENKPIVDQTQADVNKREEVLEKILENLPTEVAIPIELPSRCKFYTLPDPASPVTLRPMTFEDEKVIISSQRGTVDPLNLILDRCVDNIDMASLFMSDKMFLILKLREISYGKDFAALVTCPSCKVEGEVNFDLTKLPINYMDDSFENPIEVQLPGLGKSAKVRIPTVADEATLADAEQMLEQLWRFVVEIDGHANREIISEVINKLPVKDIHTILNVISGDDFGIQTKVKFECPSCADNSILEMPITPDFFTVS
tara:strand:+ start:686 stop:1468 length:783 start_codon:yes stop_codon:yes gene_type:complete